MKKQKHYTLTFTLAELQDVLSHVERNQRGGAYWGNLRQFLARQDSIIAKCKTALARLEGK